MTNAELIALYRPVGQKELDLIAASGFRAFPPRLPFQPIFYPVLTEDYAVQIARDGTPKTPPRIMSATSPAFTSTRIISSVFPVQTVGSSEHQEYWIPAEEVETFNQNIVGTIEVVAEFHPS